MIHKTSLITEYLSILDSSISILRSCEYSFDKSTFLWEIEDDLDISNIDLGFHPLETVKNESTIVIPHYNSSLCTLCYKRISYKPRQFDKNQPVLPFLIITYNVFLTKQQNTFNDPNIDKEFQALILKGTNHPVDSFLIREALRCHFGTEEVNNAIHFDNCRSHIEKDILNFGIKGMLVIGEAINIVFKNKKDVDAYLYKIDTYLGIPTIATPGPSRLVFMQQKGYPADRIHDEKLKIESAILKFGEMIR